MLRPRIIPCLLLKNGGLVKTVNFGNEKYVGDPFNVVKILNEKEVDELIVLDILRSSEHKEIDFKLVENISSECRMPLCYGGGVNNLEQIKKLISIGVEKIALSSSLFHDNGFVEEAVRLVGSQSIVAILDVKKQGKDYLIFTNNGKKNTKIKLFDFVKRLTESGVGEIVVNSIDLDGTMKGYDLDIVGRMKEIITTPFTILGGASSHDNIKKLFHEYGNVGAGVGSLFVFKGVFKAVLVNYPNREEKASIFYNSR